MRYITDQHANDIPALQGLTAKQQREVLGDADHVYEQVEAHPWIDDAGLRERGKSNGLTPERIDDAVSLLTQTGRLLVVENQLAQTSTKRST